MNIVELLKVLALLGLKFNNCSIKKINNNSVDIYIDRVKLFNYENIK